MPNFIDLFAGAGGFSEGFMSEDFNAIAHVEMNINAAYTLKTRACYYYLRNNGRIEQYYSYLKKHINREELYEMVPVHVLNTVINKTMESKSMSDIYTLIDRNMAEQKIEKVDLIIGGPPCQAYSLISRAVSNDEVKQDNRNFLYKLYAQVLKRYNPEMFVFENVPGLLTASKGKYFDNMRKYFKRVGYELDFKKLNSSKFGVLQSRERIILIGWRKGSDHYYPDFEFQAPEYTVSDIFNDLPKLQAGEEKNRYRKVAMSEYLSRYNLREENDALTWHTARPHIERDKEIYRRVISAWQNGHTRLKYNDLPEELCTHKNREAFLDRFKVVAADLPACHTMLAHIAKDGHYFIHPDINQARSITVREAARIQSFPDSYFFEGARTAAFIQIGNAVPPIMAAGIASKIKDCLRVKNNNG